MEKWKQTSALKHFSSSFSGCSWIIVYWPEKWGCIEMFKKKTLIDNAFSYYPNIYLMIWGSFFLDLLEVLKLEVEVISYLFDLRSRLPILYQTQNALHLNQSPNVLIFSQGRIIHMVLSLRYACLYSWLGVPVLRQGQV